MPTCQKNLNLIKNLFNYTNKQRSVSNYNIENRALFSLVKMLCVIA